MAGRRAWNRVRREPAIRSSDLLSPKTKRQTKMKTQITPAALGALCAGDMENFIAAATPGGIEAQEKRGQIEQTFAETLPKDGTTGKDRKQWEALGFMFGDAADDIFVNVKFPNGWRKKPTDHSMWIELLDDKGRKRGAIFYKAAFYDRSAHVHIEARFSYSSYESTSKKDEMAVVIRDAGETSQTIGTWKAGEYTLKDELEAKAKKWLIENYPKWQEASEYWA